MKTFLKKKFLKTIPIWSIIALILSTTIAIGALTWISNSRVTTLSVTAWEIDIAPTSDSTDIKKGEMNELNFPYDSNSVDNTVGYLYIKFEKDMVPTTTNEISMGYVGVNPSGSSLTMLTKITSYPIIDDGIVVIYGATDSTSFDFGDAGGDIKINFLPNDIDYDIIEVRVTSGLPP